MAVSEELEVLKEVTRRLEESAIAYMITGSMAANFYATPRMTRDIDIVVELSGEDIDRLVAVFEKDRKSTRLNSSHIQKSRMPSSA